MDEIKPDKLAADLSDLFVMKRVYTTDLDLPLESARSAEAKDDMLDLENMVSTSRRRGPK